MVNNIQQIRFALLDETCKSTVRNRAVAQIVRNFTVPRNTLEIGDFLQKAKRCAKHREQLSQCSILASKHSAQLSLSLKSATFFKKLNLVKNTVHNCPVARNWRQNTVSQLRKVFWTCLTFLTKVANFKQNDSSQSVLTPISKKRTVVHGLLENF